MKTLNVQFYVNRNNSISDWKMVKEKNGETVFELCGRFTKGQLKAFVDALTLENDEFKLPDSFTI